MVAPDRNPAGRAGPLRRVGGAERPAGGGGGAVVEADAFDGSGLRVNPEGGVMPRSAKN